jgi:hypothetical protein
MAGVPTVLFRLVLLLAAITAGVATIPIPKIRLSAKTSATTLLFTLVLFFIFTSINSYKRL